MESVELVELTDRSEDIDVREKVDDKRDEAVEMRDGSWTLAVVVLPEGERNIENFPSFVVDEIDAGEDVAAAPWWGFREVGDCFLSLLGSRAFAFSLSRSLNRNRSSMYIGPNMMMMMNIPRIMVS